MNKLEAIELLHSKMSNQNLRKHCYAVGIAMGGIHDYLKSIGKNPSESREEWEVLGILHDSDYEITKDDWDNHTLLTLEWLIEYGYDEGSNLYRAIQSHNNKRTNLREPQTQMEWALECVDELTGFIVACALVLSSKKLSDLTVDSIKKKWKQPSFAKGVIRGQTEQVEEKLGINLDQFIELTLIEMQKNSDLLGL